MKLNTKNVFVMIKNIFLYGGLDKNEYDNLVLDALEDNRINLIRYTFMGSVIYTVLIAANILVKSMSMINQRSYMVSAVCMISLYCCTKVFSEKYPKMVVFLSYLFMSFLYAFSMVIMSYYTNQPTVSTIVFMMVIPLLFVDRPIKTILITIVVVIAFCILSLRLKPIEIAKIDIWNGVTYGFIAVALEILMMRVRLQNLAQANEIKRLSEIDVLTGCRNRNCYEKKINEYNQIIKKNIICIYVDVNGLHELNNTKGHNYGDIMLQTVAKELIRRFGADNIYRIGGDEFVVLIDYAPLGEVEESIRLISIMLEEEKYHASFGIAELYKSGMSVKELIIEAEHKMYEVKNEYYMNKGNSRRR